MGPRALSVNASWWAPELTTGTEAVVTTPMEGPSPREHRSSRDVPPAPVLPPPTWDHTTLLNAAPSMNDRDRPHVFVSYRSGDRHAERVVPGLASRLKRDLGDARVYYAPTDNTRGSDFERTVARALADAHLVVAVVGPRWETGLGDHTRFTSADDWVRRELATALADPPTPIDLLLVGRRRLPAASHLPPDLRPLSTRQATVDFTLDRDYHGVLVRAWVEFHARHPDALVIVTDASREARVDLQAFTSMMRDEGLVDESRLQELSGIVTSPPGTTVVPLTEAAADFDRVLLLTPSTITERWRRRERAVEGWARDHPTAIVRTLAASTIVTLASVASALQSAAPAAATTPTGTAATSTGSTSSGTGSTSAATSTGGGAAGGGAEGSSSAATTNVLGWWQGLGLVAKVAVLGSSAALVATGAAVAVPDPVPLAGTWNVTNFTLEGEGVNLDGEFDIDQMAFEPVDAECETPGCDLVVATGPSVLLGTEMTSERDLFTSRYVSSDLSTGWTCQGTEVPGDLTDTRLVATAGPGSTLDFSLVVDFPDFETCEATTLRYAATATQG